MYIQVVNKLRRVMNFKEVTYVAQVPTDTECIIGADIGGTNANFGIFRQVPNNGLELLLSIHYKSQEISSFVQVVQHLLHHLLSTYALRVEKICVAAAGVISEDRTYVKPTNLKLIIRTDEIKAQTDLKCIYLVNDFEIIGYGIQALSADALFTVNEGRGRHKANYAVIGAGTGLGKSILVWHEQDQRYIPSPSEGGHADMAVQTELELEMITFIKEYENRNCNISWEDVLSGNGIHRIYNFFRARNGNNDVIIGPHPDEIFKNKDRDASCQQTYQMYVALYGRCVKNFALDALALNGIYIAGGIAAHNAHMFKSDYFMHEFINCGKQKELLQNIPVKIITDYNVSLYGAAKYMLLEGLC